MNYEPFDSSETDDDLPPPHQNRIPRGGNVSRNGIGSAAHPRMFDEKHMEGQIHLLEQEAYCSVLRAFKAQADAITWEKESLITELRKELRLSNEEHRELLTKVNADDVIPSIREWRQAGGIQPGMLPIGQAVYNPALSPSVSASHKKLMIYQATPSQSFGGPPPSFRPVMAASNLPPSSAARKGPISRSKQKRQKNYPPSGPTPRRPLGNHRFSGVHGSQSAEAGSFSPLLGRKVRTRWPDDNNFYEVVITDYNPIEIAPEDIQWVDEDLGKSHPGSYGVLGLGMNRSSGFGGAVGTGRGRGLLVGQSRKGIPTSPNGIGKMGLDDIKLLHTDYLIKEVERIFGSSHPDPTEIEEAKKVLKDHEQALIDAIARLAYMSDDESDEAHHSRHEQQMEQE